MECYLVQLSRTAPPPLPGGYCPGDEVFYTGASQTFPDGDRLVQGAKGEVTGPATTSRRLAGRVGEGVCVQFPEQSCGVGCFLTELSRTAP